MYFRRLIRDTFNCINIIDEKVENTLARTKDRKSQSNLLEIKKDESNRFSSFSSFYDSYIQKYKV